jgi:hypothetical protein
MVACGKWRNFGGGKNDAKNIGGFRSVVGGAFVYGRLR